MPIVVSLTFAAAFVVVNLWLALRIVQLRRSQGVLTGDGGDPRLLARMRAQANFAEWVPLCLILLALLELSHAARQPLWLLGSLLVLARLLHAFGMEGARYNRLRMAGIGLTWSVALALALWALARATLMMQVIAGPQP